MEQIHKEMFQRAPGCLMGTFSKILKNIYITKNSVKGVI